MPSSLKYILFWLALIFIEDKLNAQSFEINATGLFINGVMISNPIPEEQMVKSLGMPDRVFNGINHVYTYDKLGIHVYCPLESKFPSSFVIDFITGKYHFEPKKTFQGKLVINGVVLRNSLVKEELSNVPDFVIDPESTVESIYGITHNDLNVSFHFKDSILESVGLYFSNNQGEFKAKSEANAQVTIADLSFEYEQGKKNLTGKKIGIWEYYDAPKVLSLKYDYEQDSILFIKSAENHLHFGIIWEDVRPEIPARPIASIVSLVKWITTHTTYPQDARIKSISGRVEVSFVVSVEGKIKNVKIETDIGGNCGAAAVAAIQSLPFDWIAARDQGKILESKFVVPFEFSFEEPLADLPLGTRRMLPPGKVLPKIRIIAVGTPMPR